MQTTSNKKPDPAVKICLELWGIPLLSKDWQNKLDIARRTPEMVSAMLVRLLPSESLVLDLLVHNENIQPRSWLVSKSRCSKDEIEQVLEQLVLYGIVTVSKNRSRLDDSADRVELNKDLADTIQKNQLVTRAEKKSSTLIPVWNLLGPLNHPLEYAESCGGVLPQEAVNELGIDEIPQDCFTISLLNLEQGYLPVFVAREGAASHLSGDERGLLERLDGLAVVARILRHTARARMRACEGLQPGKREVSAWAEAAGYPVEQVRLIFSWLSLHGWLADEEGLLTPTQDANDWLALDGKQRHSVMASLAASEFPGNSLPERGSLWRALVQNAVPSRGLNTIEDWLETCRGIRRLIDDVAFYWYCGVFSLQLTGGHLQKIIAADYEQILSDKSGSLVVTGDMTIVIAETVASAWQVLMLTAFCKIERDSGMIRARLHERTFMEGLAAGFDGNDLLAILEHDAGPALPQNIVFTVKDWIESPVGASLQVQPVLRIEDPRLEELMHDPAFAKLVDRRAGPHDIILNGNDKRELATILEKHGIILDYRPTSRELAD